MRGSRRKLVLSPWAVPSGILLVLFVVSYLTLPEGLRTTTPHRDDVERRGAASKVSTSRPHTWLPDTVVGARNQRRHCSGPRVITKPQIWHLNLVSSVSKADEMRGRCRCWMSYCRHFLFIGLWNRILSCQIVGNTEAKQAKMVRLSSASRHADQLGSKVTLLSACSILFSAC